MLGLLKCWPVISTEEPTYNCSANKRNISAAGSSVSYLRFQSSGLKIFSATDRFLLSPRFRFRQDLLYFGSMAKAVVVIC